MHALACTLPHTPEEEEPQDGALAGGPNGLWRGSLLQLSERLK